MYEKNNSDMYEQDNVWVSYDEDEQYDYTQDMNGASANRSSMLFARVLVIGICSIFILVGIIMLLVGVKLSSDNKAKEDDFKEITGVITKIDTYRSGDDTRYIVLVEYEYEGKIYGGEINYYTSSMYVGKEIDLLYDTTNPGNYKVPGILGNPGFIFMIIGGSFVVLPTIVMIICLVATRTKKKTSTMM